MTLSSIGDWLAGLMPGTAIYTGSIDANKTQCIGVYQRPDPANWNQAIGAPSTYQQTEVKFLVHWGTGIRDCETKALDLFNLLLANRTSTINNRKLINILTRAPVNIGRDEKGVFESIVICTIFYETE